MNPAWRHRLRRLRFFLFGWVASVFIALAIVMALGQLLLPLAARYPSRIAALLSDRLGRPVTFRSLEGFWQPSGPLFTMRDVSVAGENGAPPLHLPTAALKLDFGGLVLPSRHLLNLRLADLHVGLRRDVDGRWSVDGFNAGGRSQTISLDHLSADLWLSNLRLDVTDDASKRHYGVIADQVRVSLQGHTVRAGGILRRDNGGGVLTAAARFAEDASSGTLYLKGSDLDFAALTADIDLDGRSLAAGRGSFETWLQWRDAHVVRATSRVDLEGLKVREADRTIATSGLHGLFDMHLDARLGQRRLDWAGTDGSDVAVLLSRDSDAPRATVVARHLELAPLAPWAGVLPQLSPSLARWLGEGRPRGRLDDVRVEWNGQTGLRFAHASFAGLGIDASGTLPGISSLHGEISGDPEAVALHLPTQPTTIDATGVFAHPLAMSGLGGDIAAYQDDDGAWHIGVDPLDVRGQGYGGQVRGDLVLPAGDGGPFMDMYVALGEGEVTAAKLFWPVHSMSEGSRNWLNRALVSGHIRSGSALFRGNLRDFPFRNQEGRFEGHVDIDDTVLDYGTGWPRAEGIAASASFVDNGMSVDASEGHALGNAISHATADIADFGDGVLDLRVSGAGTGASYLDFVKNSPVGASSRDALDKMQLGGTGEFGFNLTLPMKHAQDFTLDGKATIRDADLVADTWKLRLDKITGDMAFDGKGFRATGLKTAFQGQPATLDVAIAGGTSDPSKIVDATLTGGFTVAELVSGYDTLKWLGDIGRGRGTFRVGFELDRADQGPATQWLTVNSDLRGVELRMPTPVKKPAASPQPLSVRVGLPVEGASLDLALGDVVRGRLRLPDDSRRVPMAAAFNLGSAVPSTLPPEGYLFGGHATNLDVSGWVQYVVGMASGNGGPGLYGLDLSADDGEVFGQHFANMHLVAKPGPTELALRVDSDGMAGQLTVPNDDLRRRGITARMDRLWWPAADDAADAARKGKVVAGAATATAATVARAEDAGAKKPADSNEAGVAPSSLPPLHLHVSDMRLGKAKLGEARLETWPTDEGLHVDQLRAQSRQVQITATGDWIGDDKHSRTHLAIDFAAEDVARMLDALGFVGIFQGGRTSARLDATWPGGPSALALANMNGTLRIDIANGRILEVQPGVGRLFGLVSVAELPRRLSLDFGDVLGKGFGFDAITGDFQFADGTATTHNLKIRAPAAEITITGRTGLRTRDYDQQMLVVPHLGNSLPVVGALAAGPVGAAAGLAVQGLLGHGLNQAARKRYHIGGSWDKPVITPVDKDTPVGATSTP
ncbi:YhdP family protein [Luteibacter sp. PPL201]|uniref:YhdP family protein n=1 Tax=Luteibacter sahnii TaxID=3021977 RepID=A0ABT6B6Z1_9GAMM|nr:YhdP family protein [Luteibacter sp. PPL193]MDY1548205.1 YhdP family protein [Luteibacter sp. PPL193]